MDTFNYISPFAEKEKPQNNSKLITDKPLSIFGDDFSYFVEATMYVSGKHTIDSFLKSMIAENQIKFFCETVSQDSSNLFGTTFLVKIGSKFKALLSSLDKGIEIKINSKLNTNSPTTALQVSTFDSLLNEIYKFLQKDYADYIENGFLTFEKLKNMILDEISIVGEISKTIGDSMSWYNDGVEYVIENLDVFLEGLLFEKGDYTPKKNNIFSDNLEFIIETIADYMIPDSIEKKLSQIKSDIGKLIQKSIPESWKQLIHKIYAYIEQTIEIFNGVVNIAVAGFSLYKAYLCGLINGLISTIQFVIQVLGWLAKSKFNQALTGELYLNIQTILETFEDFIDVFNQSKDDIIEGVKNLIKNFDLDSCLSIVKSLYGNTKEKYTIYDYAYLAGRIIFEIVIAVLLTLLTGGGEAIKLASSLSQEALEIAKLIGKEALSVATGGIIDLAALLKSFLLKFAQACKKGWKALQKFFEDLLNIGKPKTPKEEVIEEVLIVVPRKKKIRTRGYTKTDVKELAKVRKMLNAGWSKNVAFTKGYIGGKKINLKSRSGAPKGTIKNFDNFNQIKPENYNYKNGPLNRQYDSEQKQIEYLHELFKNNKSVKGKIEIVSELKICDNCNDIIRRFQIDFPNIEIVKVWVKEKL